MPLESLDGGMKGWDGPLRRDVTIPLYLERVSADRGRHGTSLGHSVAPDGRPPRRARNGHGATARAGAGPARREWRAARRDPGGGVRRLAAPACRCPGRAVDGKREGRGKAGSRARRAPDACRGANPTTAGRAARRARARHRRPAERRARTSAQDRHPDRRDSRRAGPHHALRPLGRSGGARVPAGGCSHRRPTPVAQHRADAVGLGSGVVGRRPRGRRRPRGATSGGGANHRWDAVAGGSPSRRL